MLHFYQQSGAILNEEFQRIKTNLEFSSFKENYRTFSFSSPEDGEGKTTTICHLALTMAREGKKVLLIDGNFKKPSLEKLFQIKSDIGLSNVILGQKKLVDTINTTEFEGLHLLTTGPYSNQIVKLIHSSAMNNLLLEAKRRFDFVLIDTEPILKAKSGKILSSKCDGTIMIVRNKKTNAQDLCEAKQALISYGANVLGVIYNDKRYGLLSRLKNR